MIDRNKRSLAIGQTIRVRQCVGPYGQCSTYEGTVENLYPGGATLKLAHSATVNGYRCVEHKNPGESIYVSIPHDGYEKFEDFEHGHETWAEIVP